MKTKQEFLLQTATTASVGRSRFCSLELYNESKMKKKAKPKILPLKIN